MTGHLFFADTFEGYDDALYAALRVMAACARLGRTPTELREAMPETFATPELRLTVPGTDPATAMTTVLSALRNEGAVFDAIDGARVRHADGWWLLRPSNTQAMLSARAAPAPPVSNASSPTSTATSPPRASRARIGFQFPFNPFPLANSHGPTTLADTATSCRDGLGANDCRDRSWDDQFCGRRLARGRGAASPMLLATSSRPPPCMSARTGPSVGKAALERMALPGTATATSFKRYMGTDRRIRLGKRDYGAEDLSALVLRACATMSAPPPARRRPKPSLPFQPISTTASAARRAMRANWPD
jgi:hypothetical protein